MKEETHYKEECNIDIKTICEEHIAVPVPIPTPTPPYNSYQKEGYGRQKRGAQINIIPELLVHKDPLVKLENLHDTLRLVPATSILPKPTLHPPIPQSHHQHILPQHNKHPLPIHHLPSHPVVPITSPFSVHHLPSPHLPPPPSPIVITEELAAPPGCRSFAVKECHKIPFTVPKKVSW